MLFVSNVRRRRAYSDIPGQHQLLGWSLSPLVLVFLIAVGADMEGDEYG